MISRLLLLAVVVALLISSTACSRIPPSFAGVKVDNWASDDKGAITSLGRGRVWYNPFTQDLYVFPLHIQRVVYEGDQAISVRSKDNATLTLNVGHAYQFQEAKVSSIFQKFRTDPETLATGVIRDAVRGAFTKAAGQHNVMDLLGPKLTAMQDEALLELRTRLSTEGISSDQLYIVGRPGIDQAIEQSINTTLSMIQEANKEEEKVRARTAIANQKIADARGDAESTLLRARAEAESAKLLTQELSDLVLRNHALSKWNGVLPQMMTGSTVPMITLPTR